MPIYELNGKIPGISNTTFVHPDAVLIGEISIGENCFIGPGAIIRGDFGPVFLKDGISLQDNVVIHVSPGSSVIIEENAIIGHSVILHDVHIAPRAVIGMGAILLFNVICEEDAFVAAGSVLKKGMRVPAGMIAGGNPAKILRNASDEQIRHAAEGVQLYQDLARQYRETLKRI
ncbi:MAG: gamma carbonic anhydrase family protein [Syntrophales bacterium]|jgi:carbonic anhydrase/acetyltransferase-like protein (isoleucine patch superfamily)|nr:gamma carbonic anhydrase family protein [Syntrophales bacterium]MDY0043416.1 gamma carbonic anhydrase family protein [Syntrophales bacterium]